mmetsp:Transcript_42036/g.124723  ORF Transcript_42036/g.124723 Transcript_42036/m.124723 type:complete len:240 (+) Transcript_42036:177-896(+)
MRPGSPTCVPFLASQAARPGGSVPPSIRRSLTATASDRLLAVSGDEGAEPAQVTSESSSSPAKEDLEPCRLRGGAVNFTTAARSFVSSSSFSLCFSSSCSRTLRSASRSFRTACCSARRFRNVTARAFLACAPSCALWPCRSASSVRRRSAACSAESLPRSFCTSAACSSLRCRSFSSSACRRCSSPASSRSSMEAACALRSDSSLARASAARRPRDSSSSLRTSASLSSASRRPRSAS